MRKQKVEDVLRRNPDMPEYMKRAYRAYQETGDRNIRRFAQAASEFQKQELREQLMQHIDDPEKLNRMGNVRPLRKTVCAVQGYRTERVCRRSGNGRNPERKQDAFRGL